MLPPSEIRKDYQLGELLESDAAADPFEQFARWFTDAERAKMIEVNAMTLATVDAAGNPSARMVLLKGFDSRGFTFFTNYQSRKGRELAVNPHASLVFFWAPLERQIRIGGSVQKVTREESENYFHSRPVKSQVAAWVSQQSSVVASRDQLTQRQTELTQQYAGKEVPVPDYWGGYRLAPVEIEFWQGRRSRLHDRLLYTRVGENWKRERLSP